MTTRGTSGGLVAQNDSRNLFRTGESAAHRTATPGKSPSKGSIMNRTSIACLLAITLGLGLSACDAQNSPTAPSTKATTDARHDTALLGSWYRTSPTENLTYEFRADSTLRVVSDRYDAGAMILVEFKGIWSTEAGKVTTTIKSATERKNGGAATPTTNFDPLLLASYAKKGDSLMLSVGVDRVSLRKGVAPALVRPVDPRHDAALIASWFSTSTFENVTIEYLADSSMSLAIEEFEGGKILRTRFLGSWSTTGSNLTVLVKSATRSIDGGTAAPYADFKYQSVWSYVLAGDSLVVTQEGERDVYRKGTAPALIAPSLKNQVIGSWKGKDLPYESILEILADGTYRQTTKMPATSGGFLWTRVEGNWAVGGTTLVLGQVKMSESTDGKFWSLAADFAPLTEEWVTTLPTADLMKFQAEGGTFDFDRL